MTDTAYPPTARYQEAACNKWFLRLQQPLGTTAYWKQAPTIRSRVKSDKQQAHQEKIKKLSLHVGKNDLRR